MGFFYPEWPSIVRIDVTNPPVTTGYQVKVEIPWQPGMRDNFSDLRFSDYFRTLPYWIETHTARTTATIWVQCTETGEAAREYFCYYGNGGASSESDGGAVFDFFDDFLGTSLDTNKWTTSGGTVSVSDSIVTITTGGYIQTKSTFPLNSTLEARHKFTATGADAIGFWDNGGNSAMWYSDGATNLIYMMKAGATSTPATNGLRGEFYNFKIKWASDQVRFYQNDVEFSNSPFTTTANIPIISLPIQLRAGGTTKYNYADWLAIRKYQSTEPVCTPAESGINTAFYQGYLRAKGLITAAAGITLTAIQHLTHIDLSWSEVG